MDTESQLRAAWKREYQNRRAELGGRRRELEPEPESGSESGSERERVPHTPGALPPGARLPWWDRDNGVRPSIRDNATVVADVVGPNHQCMSKEDVLFTIKTPPCEKGSAHYETYKTGHKSGLYTQTDCAPGAKSGIRFAAKADGDIGFFRPEMLTLLYNHLLVEGKVIYSIKQGTPLNPGPAIQFFRDAYICSHAAWWDSKFIYDDCYMEEIGRGAWNKTERPVLKHALTAADPYRFLPTFDKGWSFHKEGYFSYLEELKGVELPQGLVLRTGFDSGECASDGVNKPIREAMLSCLASANGFGPRVFATWVVPEDSYYPRMPMNEGDTFFHWRSGITRDRPDEMQSDRSVWWSASFELKDEDEWTGKIPVPRNLMRVDVSKLVSLEAERPTLQYRVAYSVIEGYQGLSLIHI